MAHNHSYKVTIKKLPEQSEVEIKSSIPAKEFAEAIAHTLESIKADATLPGFRKGMAPEKMIREKIGEGALLSEAAEHAISHAYGHIIHDEKIDAIGAPKVAVTKIAADNDLEFTITTAVLPEIGKFDYKKIAAAANKLPLEVTPVTEEALAKMKEEDAEATKEDMEKQAEYRAQEKKRLALVDALTKDLPVVIPEILVEGELAQMASQMKADIERMGISFAEYLKHIAKTEDDLKKDWRKDAEKRVKLDLLIATIAKDEKIMPDKDKVDAEVKRAQAQYEGVDEERARSYFLHIFLNQAVFEFLEAQK